MVERALPLHGLHRTTTVRAGLSRRRSHAPSGGACRGILPRVEAATGAPTKMLPRNPACAVQCSAAERKRRHQRRLRQRQRTVASRSWLYYESDGALKLSWKERRLCKPEVTGSIPVRSIERRSCLRGFSVLLSSERNPHPCKRFCKQQRLEHSPLASPLGAITPWSGRPGGNPVSLTCNGSRVWAV